MCGLACVGNCPTGFSCNGFGACAGGDPGAVNLDVKTCTVSGKVTLNGAKPSLTAVCLAGRSGVQVSFTEQTQGYSFQHPIPCTTTDFAYSAELFPGTYRVTVRNRDYWDSSPYGWATNLPPSSSAFVANPALVVSGNLTSQTLNVKTHTVSGKVTLTGVEPSITSICTPSRTGVQVNFAEQTKGYSFNHFIPCTTSDYAFSVTLFPGTDRVTVRNRDHTEYSPFGWATNLPQNASAAVIVEALEVEVGSSPPASGRLVISQVFGGGGNSGAPYTHDFIELFNPGPNTVSLTGWSVQYAPATGISWQTTPLAGLLAGADAKDNATDFTAASPTPRGSATAASPCS